MAAISIKSFGGISPKTPTRLLQDSQAQVAINCPVFAGTLNPLPDLSAAITTLGKTNTPQTIYRFGQDITSDSQYWFSWATDVDVCRGQISGDTSEWTFYTGDGAPKATYASIALSDTEYPAVSRPLGLPKPAEPLTIALEAYNPTVYPATITLTATMISYLTVDDDILFSITDDVDGSYVTVPLTAPINVTTVAAALDAATGINASVVDGEVVVKSDATGETAKLFVKAKSGQTVDEKGTFTYLSGYDVSATGASQSLPMLVIDDSEIGALDINHQIVITGDGEVGIPVPGVMTATTLAALLTSSLAGAFTATVKGSSVWLTPGLLNQFMRYQRFTPNGAQAKVMESSISYNPAPASLTLVEADVLVARDKYMSITANGVEKFVFIPPTATISSLNSLLYGTGVHLEVFGTQSQSALLNSDAVGTNVTIRYRLGSYPVTPQYGKLTSEGYSDTPASTETRVYAWTWVNKEAGFEFESTPSDATASVDAYFDQGVYLSGRSAVPAGYVVTHWRLYRSVNGTYLLVDELPVSRNTYTDTKLAEDLSETIPSLTWTPPPAALRGLTNLPNGIMAGFVGRDVYFCDPYHPHAWPEQYIQSVDYPVVGLGRMDTTLAVLTTGTPYFLQGSHPDSITVVRSDLEQACASKRSIVSTNGVVIYASPDGLVLLSSSGSKLITENVFTRAQWQAYFRPESIHAYSHDLKYIAFYDNGTTQGGFIFDPTSGQIILHDIYATAGFSDLQRDQLFLSSSNRTIKTWIGGAPKSLTWKSKKFWMPKPVGYTCAQLEAEAYPVTLKVYVDGTLGHTATVADRTAFRLPVLVGRDWEFQIEGTAEVFSLAIATSMEEIAGV